MALSDAVDAVGRLVTAFGPKEITQERVALYAEELQDVEPALLQESVRRVIREAKFFPSVGEILQAVLRVSGKALPSTPEAIAIIRRADVREPVYRRDGSLAYTERYWRWPDDLEQPVLDALQDVLAKVGEPADPNDESYFAWDTGFGKVYEQESERVAKLALSGLKHLRLPGHKPKELGS